ncbi:hypothetical protein KY347_04875 [Candidatus Woesearchaeota archaeon]|nr:hypothetical protein [Candidatus Woesearchaeota archaeon]
MGVNNLNKKLDDVLEKLHYLEMVIRNLKDRDGTLITEVGEIDERLFREIANYELSTEELKKDFVLLLLQDAKRLGGMCINNVDLFNKVSEEFGKIDEVLDFIKKHEDKDIRKSEELQEFAAQAKIRLDSIRKEVAKRSDEEKKERKHLRDTEKLQKWK